MDVHDWNLGPAVKWRQCLPTMLFEREPKAQSVIHSEFCLSFLFFKVGRRDFKSLPLRMEPNEANEGELGLSLWVSLVIH